MNFPMRTMMCSTTRIRIAQNSESIEAQLRNGMIHQKQIHHCSPIATRSNSSSLHQSTTIHVPPRLPIQAADVLCSVAENRHNASPKTTVLNIPVTVQLRPTAGLLRLGLVLLCIRLQCTQVIHHARTLRMSRNSDMNAFLSPNIHACMPCGISNAMA